MQVEMTIKGLMVDPITNTPIVILRDKDGDRVLPIWVGIFEARAIAMQIENLSTPRPATHDLLRNVIHDLDATVTKIVVSDLQDNTFYALIYLTVRGEPVAIDARPSDAIALALRARAPIYVEESVIDHARKTGSMRARKSGRPPSGCRSGSRAWIPTISANTRCNRVPDSSARCVHIPDGRRRMIVAIANQKGGVGKTTTAINLAAALALRGKPTLLIDLDPQANSTMSFLDMSTVTRSVYAVIVEPAGRIDDVIVQSPVPNLSIAPSRIALAKLEAKLVGEMDAHFRLKDKLEPLLNEYPNVVIDCPPTLGLLTVNALVAATHLLIPIQSSYFALEGTDDLLETIEKVRQRANPALQILGVVITMHDKRTSLARDIRAQIDKVFGSKVFKTVITKSVRLEESPAYKESIFTFAPESTGASEYYRLCEEVIDRA